MKDNFLNRIEDSRRRERFEYKERIFSFKYLVSGEESIKKIPILLNILDISYSGLGISSNQRLISNSILIFSLENQGVIREFKVEVMWCKYSLSKYTNDRYKCGVHFIDLTYDDVIFIDGIIRNL